MRVGWALLLVGACAGAQPGRELAYPDAEPDGARIAEQVYFVNHYQAVDNISFRDGGHGPPALVHRQPERDLRVLTAERHLTNEYPGQEIRARDLAVYHSGPVRGTGVLVTLYADPARPPSLQTWLPALRKVRRVMVPAQDERWPGTNLTYGDVYLRKPQDETHSVLAKERFGECLGSLEAGEDSLSRYRIALPGPQCAHKDSQVYKLKSTTRFRGWWYEHRITWVDARSFADYRSVYYKDGEPIKIVDKDWAGMGLDDPRGLYPRYWYARSLDSGEEALALLPEGAAVWNQPRDPGFWSERTLRRLSRR